MTEAHVWQTVEELNRLWTAGDGSGLERYFHAEMVAINPAQSSRIEGRAACVEAWQSFARSVRIFSWETFAPWIRLFGNTAIVAYCYELSCEIGGQPVLLRGRDMMTLVQDDGSWQLVADHFSPDPGSAG